MMPASALSAHGRLDEAASAVEQPRNPRRWPRMLVAMALVGPSLAGDPDKQVLRDRLQAPVFFGGSWSHPLGTDQLGRDLLARVVAGARVTLLLSA